MELKKETAGNIGMGAVGIVALIAGFFASGGSWLLGIGAAVAGAIFLGPMAGKAISGLADKFGGADSLFAGKTKDIVAGTVNERRKMSVGQGAGKEAYNGEVVVPLMDSFKKISIDTQNGIVGVGELLQMQESYKKASPEDRLLTRAVYKEQYEKAIKFTKGVYKWNDTGKEWNEKEYKPLNDAYKTHQEALGITDIKDLPKAPIIKVDMPDITMKNTPELAVYAQVLHKRFGEEGKSFNEANPTALDRITTLNDHIAEVQKKDKPNWNNTLSKGWTTDERHETGPLIARLNYQTGVTVTNILQTMSQCSTKCKWALENNGVFVGAEPNYEYAMHYARLGELIAQNGGKVFLKIDEESAKYLDGRRETIPDAAYGVASDKTAMLEWQKVQRYIKASQMQGKLHSSLEGMYTEIGRLEETAPREFKGFITNVEEVQKKVTTGNKELDAAEQAEKARKAAEEKGKSADPKKDAAKPDASKSTEAPKKEMTMGEELKMQALAAIGTNLQLTPGDDNKGYGNVPMKTVGPKKPVDTKAKSEDGATLTA